MKDKDITEKHLESFNDVFSDIINVLIFDGNNVIKENELEDIHTRSYFSENAQIRDQERDIAKIWKRENVIISFYGIENQTEIDTVMPLRVIGYDGGSYRYMLANNMKPCPVITFVLNFSNKRWEEYTSLYDCFNVNEKMTPFVKNYGINVVDVAFLPRETVNKFQSDFKIIADYFVQTRETGKYIPMPDNVRHVWELLNLMSALTKDERFRIEYYRQHRKESTNMCEVLDRIINEGEARGIAIGEARGIAKGEAIGIAKGEARGIAKGEAKGEANARISIIQKMIGRYPDEEIAYISGLSVEEIKEITKNGR